MSAFGFNVYTKRFAYAIKAAGGSRLANNVLAAVDLLAGEMRGWALPYSFAAAFDFFYPFVGGNAIAHSFNLANPTAAQITWSGTVTHNANGITGNGTTGYGDTGVPPGSSLISAGVYSRTSAAVDGYELTSALASGDDDGIIGIICRWSDNFVYIYNGIVAPAFNNLGSGASIGNTGGGFTLLAPSGSDPDDIWIAAVHSADRVAHALSGWTQIYQGNGGGLESRLSLWWFRYAGSTPNLTVGHSGGSSSVGKISSFRGLLISGNIVDTTGGGNSGTTNPTSSSGITPGTSGCLAVAVHGCSGGTPTGTGWTDSSGGHVIGGTPPSSFTLRYKLHTSGDTGGLSFSSATSDPDWAAVQTTLKPSGAIEVTAAATDGRGLFSLLRTTSSLLRGYRNGVQVGSDAIATLTGYSSANFNILRNSAGSYYSSRNLAFAFLTAAGISSATTSKQAELYTIIQRFQTRLGRQV